jgi:hypothetical protein
LALENSSLAAGASPVDGALAAIGCAAEEGENMFGFVLRCRGRGKERFVVSTGMYATAFGFSTLFFLDAL